MTVPNPYHIVLAEFCNRTPLASRSDRVFPAFGGTIFAIFSA